MKKFFSMVTAVVMAIGMVAIGTACGPKADYKVGILQLTQHIALDESNRGFQDELKSLMKAENKTVKFYNRNASGDQNTCITIATTLAAKNLDLILGIATAAAQSVYTATQEKTPTLFTAVTDAVDAKLVKSNDVPGGNMTGTSDLNPVAKQIELCKKLGALNSNESLRTKIGVFYTESETNSKMQLKLAQEAAETLGVQIIAKGSSDINNIATDYEALASQVSVIYIPTDNAIAAAAAHVKEINENGKKLPIVCGESGMTKNCGVATYGVDYYELGKLTGQMAFDILVNGKDPATMPVKTLTDKAVLQTFAENAAAIGFTFPSDL